MAQAPPISMEVWAIDHASETLDKVAGAISRTGTVTRSEMQALQASRHEAWLLYGTTRYLTQAYLSQNLAVWSGVQAFSQVGDVARMGLQLFNQYQVMMIRIDRAQRDVRDAQLAYNEAVLQYGARSPKAVQAAQDLQDAQTTLARAQQESLIFWGLAIASVPRYVQSIMQATAGLKAFIAIIGQHTSAITAESIASVANTMVQRVSSAALKEASVNEATHMLAVRQASLAATEQAIAEATGTTSILAKTAAEDQESVASAIVLGLTEAETVATGKQAAVDVAHTGILWGKVAALEAIKNALIGVQIAGIPVIGWIAAAGVTAAGIAAAYAIMQSRRAAKGGVMPEAGVVYAEKGEMFIPPELLVRQLHTQPLPRAQLGGRIQAAGLVFAEKGEIVVPPRLLTRPAQPLPRVEQIFRETVIPGRTTERIIERETVQKEKTASERATVIQEKGLTVHVDQLIISDRGKDPRSVIRQWYQTYKAIRPEMYPQ